MIGLGDLSGDLAGIRGNLKNSNTSHDTGKVWMMTLPKLHAWREQGACHTKKAPLSLFFPEAGRRLGKDDWAKGKAYCALCPVRDKCLEFGTFQVMDGTGLYGGMSPVERRTYVKYNGWLKVDLVSGWYEQGYTPDEIQQYLWPLHDDDHSVRALITKGQNRKNRKPNV